MRQYKQKPLTNENADRLANACRSGIEKAVISTLLDTGLRVSEMAGLSKENILWQDRRLRVYGKGGPYGKKTQIKGQPDNCLVPYELKIHKFGIDRRIKYGVWETASRLV